MLPSIKKLQRCDPRFVQIHPGVLLGSDAFESGIHETRRKMLNISITRDAMNFAQCTGWIYSFFGR